MSTWWKVVCRKCGHEERIHTPRMTSEDGERVAAESHAQEPCPKCGSTERELGV